MAARLRVIILDRTSPADGARIRAALWADVPAGRQAYYADSGAVSAWRDAQAGDNTAIASGAMVERVVTLQLAPGESLATVRGAAQAAWTDWQNQVTTDNPWARYGSTWDGTTWAAGGAT
jgi:hypothetical protein